MIQAEREQLDNVLTQAKRWVYVTFQKAGFHRYPDADINPTLADVAYLGQKHRHLFKFNVQIAVVHNDRDLEFHQVLNYCESLFEGTLDIDFKSVEMLADDLYIQLAQKYPNRDMKIGVSEDGECGCLIEYNIPRIVIPQWVPEPTFGPLPTKWGQSPASTAEFVEQLSKAMLQAAQDAKLTK